MAFTYEPIATESLNGLSTITFSNIPQTYTDLIFVVNSLSGDNDETYQFNSDTGSNYSWTRFFGTTTGTASSRDSNVTYLRHTAGNLTGINTTITQIMNYSSSNVFKRTLSKGSNVGNASSIVVKYTGLWRSTNPITSITLAVSSNSWSTGATASLYGIEAA